MALKRRELIKTAVLAPIAASGLTQASKAASPLRAAWVYVAPIANAGWTYQHDLGRLAAVKAFGDQLKTSYVENVSEGADATRVIHQLAQSNDLIFTTSFGFMNPTIEVAALFPKVKFDHATGYKMAPNVGIYSSRFYQGTYLSGVVAGYMTKSAIIGYVVAYPIPEVIRDVSAFTLGARSVNPKVRVKIVWTSSWYDPSKEREAAEALIGQGADVVTHDTDSTAVVEAAGAKGVWGIGYDSDMARFAPKSTLTSTIMVWDHYYVDTVKAAIDGTWKPTNVWYGFEHDYVRMAPLNPAVPPAASNDVTARVAKLSAQTLDPFTGPITDQSGSLKVAAGQKMTDQELLNMDWFVEGVEGKAG